jgi:hypothetical protein
MEHLNLIIVHRNGDGYRRDFDQIADKVHSLDQSITIFTLPASLKVELPPKAWRRRTLTVSLSRNYKVKVERGRILRNIAIEKIAQIAFFKRNGIRYPPALPFQFRMKLDPILFGDFVIFKPGDLSLTSKGSGIHVLPRTVVERLTVSDFSSDHPIHKSRSEYIVQRFVDTGVLPHKFRALTFLGKVLYISHEINQSPRPELSSHLQLDSDGQFHTVNTLKRFEPNEEVRTFAERIAALLPDIPLLGLDIIQDVSQRLYALELNAGGNVWHFSSQLWEERRRNDPTLLAQMKSQYGAFDIAAAALVEKTRRFAS